MSVTTQAIHEAIEMFNGQFMTPEIVTDEVFEVTNDYGECRWTFDNGDLESDETITEFYPRATLCRLSASGYLDCTEWTICHDENDILEWINQEIENNDL